jgi:nitroreductase
MSLKRFRSSSSHGQRVPRAHLHVNDSVPWGADVAGCERGFQVQVRDRKGKTVELYEVMRTTSAVRQFTNDPLPDQILYTILDNARFAPSGGNRQGTRVVVVRDHGTRQALVELTIPAARKYLAQRRAGENPWNTIDPSRVSDDEIAATDVAESFTAPLLEAAVVLVVCVDLRMVAALDKELDRVGIVGGASVYPLVWNILLAARNEGFGGTITTMAVAEEPRIRELLGMPETYAVACIVPLGKPVHQPRKLSRLDVAELTSLEHWHGGPLMPGARGVRPGTHR